MIDLDSKKLKNINKPARYVGGEVNVVTKNSNVKSSVVLCYPNLYEKAMSNYIVNLLYNNINEIEDVWCKRCFAPDIDFEKYLKDNDINIYSLEDFKSIKQNDILLFVIDNELDFTNILNILELGNIILDREKRDKNLPEILFLPLNNVNIEPISVCADYIFNEGIEKENIINVIKYIKNKIGDNTDINIKHKFDGVVPSININNSSIIVDFMYMNDADEIINYVEKSIKSRGVKKVSFRNIDKIDEYKFCEIIYMIKSNIEEVRIISKNIDFNKFSAEVFDIILPCLEQSSVQFNVITTSDKLRDKIGFGTDKAELIQKVNKVFRNNRNSIRLNFNIGLPEETYEDIDNIFELLDEILTIYSQNKAKDKFSMKVNLNYYIPNQNEQKKYSINSINKLETKLRYIKEKQYDPVIKMDVEDISVYFPKILLKNGDEEVYKTIYDAYKLGARFNLNGKNSDSNSWEKSVFDNYELASKYL